MKYRQKAPKNFIGTLSVFIFVGLLNGCDGFTNNVTKQSLKPEQILPLKNAASSQMAPLTLNGKDYLLLASEKRGLILLDSNGKESLSLDGGSVERFALQRQTDNNWLIAVYEETSDEIQLRLLNIDRESGKPRIHYLGAEAVAAAQAALCFSRQAERAHLFAIDETGLGFEYVVQPREQSWLFIKVRPLYFGEQANSCAVDDGSGQLLVAQPPLGIWSLNASAERDEQRQVFVAAEKLGNRFGGLWMDPDTTLLWLIAGDKVQAFDPQKPGADAKFDRVLANFKPISAVVQRGQLLALAKEGEGVLRYRAKLPRPNVKVDELHSDESIPWVSAQAQTVPVNSVGDAADDPAIWVNPANPSASLILATNKKNGLDVYTLSGELSDQFAVGRLNNVDLRPMRYGKFVAIAAATNRTDNGISLFGISAGGRVEYLGLRQLAMDDPYGLCSYRHGADLMLWASDKQGDLQLLQVVLGEDPLDWQLRFDARLKVNSQVEGCVVDDERQTLFFGEEDGGIWRLNIAAFRSVNVEPRLIAAVDGANLAADVEGMGLYHNGAHSYLVVSSQGNNSYALFSRDGSKFIGHFRVDMNLNKMVDGSSETDGLAVSSAALGSAYPAGILIVQDGRNRMPNTTQNFKLVSWADIASELGLK
ncbi:MAG: phytase [Gammaproteobacteria bacterium]|nr:phytase [Gammaproteobacteria bacterium]